MENRHDFVRAAQEGGYDLGRGDSVLGIGMKMLASMVEKQF